MQPFSSPARQEKNLKDCLNNINESKESDIDEVIIRIVENID
jgi:hypothetical protein